MKLYRITTRCHDCSSVQGFKIEADKTPDKYRKGKIVKGKCKTCNGVLCNEVISSKVWRF